MAVDVLDQMVRLYSTKAASRRWPIHICYNILDMALINSWIVYCQVTNSSISRRVFIQKVSEELTGFTEQHSSSPSSAPIQAKVRRTCATPRCKNRTNDAYGTCSKAICEKCATKTCAACLI